MVMQRDEFHSPLLDLGSSIPIAITARAAEPVNCTTFVDNAQLAVGTLAIRKTHRAVRSTSPLLLNAY
jgi:hypothetical protein